MLEDWAGVAIIVSVQIITFFFIKRRLDRLDEAISRLEKAVAEFREEMTEQIAAFKEDLLEQMATMKAEPPLSCCAKNLRGTATTKNEQTMCMCIYCDFGVVNARSGAAPNTPGRPCASHSDANCR